MKQLIRNVRLVCRDQVVTGYLVIDGGKIAEVGRGLSPETPEGFASVDGKGLFLSPGFFELHTHGAGGSDFLDESPDDMVTGVMTHLQHGTTSILPTTVAASRKEMIRCIDNFKLVKKNLRNGPNLIGLHMEGPYLSPLQKGAIDAKYIRNPDPAEYCEMVERAEGGIARWTVAPELPGALEMGDYLVKHHVLPSIGHSNAEYPQVLAAYRHGFTHVTHLYSGMSSIVRRGGFRFLGVTESAYAVEGLTVEVIADGCHLPPELLRTVYRLKGPDKVCMVCDSMRCAGTDATETELGSRNSGQKVIVEDGVAKMPDRKAFAGSIATDDRLVRVMHYKAGVPLYDCINMMCLTPARIMGLGSRKGSLEAGKDADLVLFDDSIDVKAVLVGGKLVFQKKAGTTEQKPKG